MSDIKIVCQNKKVFHDYFVEETFEAGLALKGTEVKSLRAGKASLADSYADIEGGEIFLLHCHINPYDAADQFNHAPMRKRKLLLRKQEISRLYGKVKERGHTLIPVKIYFKKGKAKVELCLAKGKKLHDKRDSIKRREAEREMDQAMKSRRQS